ncbi:MAG: antibiotic biosynthesis monooxygenase [Pseudomonadota bacterium]
MVRVVYRWLVAPENFEEFQNSWRSTTNKIHKTVPGAQGSFLLKSCEDSSQVVTIAKWDCLQSWKDFWGDKNPKQMKGMTLLAERVSVEVFEEIDDQSR